MAHRIISTTTPSLQCLKYPLKYQYNNHKKAFFGTSTIQWFHRFLSPKEEKQLYMGLTTLFRERLNEKSTSSNQSYKNIIDQVILGTTTTTDYDSTSKSNNNNNISTSTLTLSQLDQFKKDIDSTGKLKDYQQLNAIWLNMKKLGQQIPITLYNRLIRAFLSCDDNDNDDDNAKKKEKQQQQPLGLLKAKEILKVIQQDQHRLPTTRSYTYMIQAHLKRHELEEAKHYVALLHRYSLDKFKTSFDCSIMMRYYIQSGDTHATDFLWRDIQRHAEIIQPGPNLFTIYAESLLSSSHTYLSHEMIADVARSFVHRFDPSYSSLPFKKEKQQQHHQWSHHQLSVWLKIVRLLTRANHYHHDFYCTDAESLLLCLINITTTTIKNTNDITPLSSSIKKQGIQAIQDIFDVYLEKAQDVKVVAFYYKLRKAGVKEDAFDKNLTITIGNVLKKIEAQHQREEYSPYHQKALLEEFGLTLRPT